MPDPKSTAAQFLGELEHEQELTHAEAMEILRQDKSERRELEMDCE